MREGWQAATVGTACKIVNGGTPKTAVASFWDGPHAWITPAEMGGLASPYVAETRRTLTDAGLDACSASLLPPQSVILSSRAPIGHLVINDVPMATNQGCKGLVPRTGLDHKFLYYFLAGNLETLRALGFGATFPELSASRLATVPIPLPPLAEQKRIVAILDAAFEGIDTAIANTEQNLANARALFAGILEATFAQVNGWPEAELQSLLATQPRNGWSPPAVHYGTGGQTPVLTLSAVTGFRYDGTKVKWSSAPTRGDAHYWAQPSEVLVTRSNTVELVGHVALYDGEPERVIVPDLIIKLLPDKTRLLGRFLYYFMRTARCRNTLQEAAVGANPTMRKISKRTLQTLIVPHPSPSLQQKISDKLDEIGERLGALEQTYERKLSALQCLRQSLLAMAFAGQLHASETALPEAAE